MKITKNGKGTVVDTVAPAQPACALAQQHPKSAPPPIHKGMKQ